MIWSSGRTERIEEVSGGGDSEDYSEFGQAVQEKIKQSGGGIDNVFDILVRENVDFRDVRY